MDAAAILQLRQPSRPPAASARRASAAKAAAKSGGSPNAAAASPPEQRAARRREVAEEEQATRQPFHRRADTYSGKDDLSWVPVGERRDILARKLPPEQQALFDIPFERWRVDPEADDPFGSYKRKATIRLDTIPTWEQEIEAGTVRRVGKVAESKRTGLCFNKQIRLIQGSVVDVAADAVVNAANHKVLGGGRVDGATHKRAGPLLLRECATFPGCATGHARITKGYGLAARFCLHAVGPKGPKPVSLRSCYRSCLDLCVKHKLRTVAFCGISTGIFGYPLPAATQTALGAVLGYLEANPDRARMFDAICFVCFREEEYECYRLHMAEYFPPPAVVAASDVGRAGGAD
eukprot:TRINITY_DN5666_c0_g1_i1.p1 TRINITY_DN5666_c0_g1~~TRINITY_DN5666_c0_g1_i1.p1  ORF type:complete len:372 (+),score=113.69 TRINITY_DN5666_c0_g1_i1:71-1117(+)